MPLLREESDAGGKFTAKYFGQSRLSDSSQSFALETLQAVTSDKMTAGAKTNPYFQAIFVDFIMLFRRFRAASTLAMNGYMGPGFTILRDISDKAIPSDWFCGRLMGVVTINYSELIFGSGSF